MLQAHIMHPQYVIRTISKNDRNVFPVLNRMMYSGKQSCFHNEISIPHTIPQTAEMILRSNSTLYVMVGYGRIHGCVAVDATNTAYQYIYCFCVEKSRRGCGRGSVLLDHVIGVHGHSDLHLRVFRPLGMP